MAQRDELEQPSELRAGKVAHVGEVRPATLQAGEYAPSLLAKSRSKAQCEAINHTTEQAKAFVWAANSGGDARLDQNAGNGSRRSSMAA